MERKEILKRINKIDSDITQIKKALKTISETDYDSFPAVYEQLTIETAIRSEMIACKFRHIIYATLNVAKPELMKKVSGTHGIEMSYADDVFTVILPSLLPKKHKSTNLEFIFDPLFFALERYCAAECINKFCECVVCFEHIYSRETPARCIRDYDNIELKQILDIITTFVMTDDSGALCDMYNTTGYGAKDMTRVSVMDKNKFKEWIAVRCSF